MPMNGLRIVGLPLTRGTSPLVLYHTQLLNRAKPKESTFLTRATDKVVGIWTGWGKAERGWKRTTYSYGQKIYDRIDFEELALKSLDPTTGPSVADLAESSNSVQPLEKGNRITIPLFHPSNFGPQNPLSHLSTLLSRRIPKHRRNFYLFILAMPLTIPFVLVPVVPNIPFFFCVWRAWSHYRAYKGGEYLDTLIESNAVIPTPSPELDDIYSESSHPATPSPLLEAEDVPRIIEMFNLSSDSGSEIIRAIKQAKWRIRKQEGEDVKLK